MENDEKKSYYGKKSIWFWIVLYIIVGGLAYWLIYYFAYARNGNGYDYSSKTNTSTNYDY
jgi:uncharacterized membrane-anchored protein